MTKIDHTPGDWHPGCAGCVVSGTDPVGTTRGHDDIDYYGGVLIAESIRTKADQELIALAKTAPHECSDPQCPGNLNRSKLELYDALHETCDGLIAACEEFVAAVLQAKKGSQS